MALAASHGSNTSQKSMGIIAMILAAGISNVGSEMPIPKWVIYSCAAAIAIGVLTGGWRIVKSVGLRISKMEPVHTFWAQLASAITMTGASLLGGPVAVSQVVGPAVLGVGASRRASGVRWSFATHIAYAWILTFPVSMVIGAGLAGVSPASSPPDLEVRNMALWKIFGQRREVDFYELLLSQSEKTLSGCQALVRFLDNEGEPEELLKLEQEASSIRRILIDELNQTFITPMDREDIFMLSRAIDDVLDHAYNTVKEMDIFEVESNEFLLQMAELLQKGAEELLNAIKLSLKKPECRYWIRCEGQKNRK